MTSIAYEDVLYRVEDGVAVITLNRPEKLNAWRAETHRDLKAAMHVAADDAAVRVIVLTGAGRGFCAGADMNNLQSLAATGDSSFTTHGGKPIEPFDAAAREDFKRQYSWFPSVPRPIIAAINGPCAGLGLIMALYADMRFASDSAVFTTAFSRRGLIAEHGISWLLPRLVGMANAADLLYSARKFDAAEALRLGMLNRVCRPEALMPEVMDYARMLATEVSPRSMREMKREMWQAQFQTLAQAIDDANADMPASFHSEDFREGIAHFVERRKPAFTGR